MKYVLFVLLIVSLCGCKRSKVAYLISDKYSGPCIVFIYPTLRYSKGTDVVLDKGFGRVSSGQTSNKFHFLSLESKKEIDVVPINEEKSINDSSRRYVFELFKGRVSSRCSKDGGVVDNIIFYVGSKEDYIRWSAKHIDSFEYFKLLGIDWCQYYKAGQ